MELACRIFERVANLTIEQLMDECLAQTLTFEAGRGVDDTVIAFANQWKFQELLDGQQIQFDGVVYIMSVVRNAVCKIDDLSLQSGKALGMIFVDARHLCIEYHVGQIESWIVRVGPFEFRRDCYCELIVAESAEVLQALV